MISDLFSSDGELLFSPGDVWDKYTILKVKLDHKLGVGLEFLRTGELLGKIDKFSSLDDKLELAKTVTELYDTNKVQWELEDRVRTEQSWEAAVAARDNNTKRVQIKNKINKLYSCPVEVKSYKGETKDT